jgi:anion-transporting  ArsA/GET3 family ATPase
VQWRDVFDTKVLVVSGKGGTGKSTVAAAVAVAAAAEGRATLLVEVEGRGEVTRTLGVPDPGFEERATPAGPSVLSISSHEAVLEYLKLFAGGPGRLGRSLIRPGLLDQVVGAAPGMRDLLICGKLYEIGQLRRTDARDLGRPLYDLIVVDGPPTGQLGGFLTAPATFGELMRIGPLKRRAERAAEFLRRRAQLLLVAIPEEMSVIETLEAIPHVRSSGVRLAAIALNRSVEPAFPRGTRRAGQELHAARLSELVGNAGIELRPSEAAGLLGEATALEARFRGQAAFLAELRRAGPILALPDVAGAPPVELVRGLASTMRERPDRDDAPAAGAWPAIDPPSMASSLGGHTAGARIVVVCGSGGVGKTSVSAAIAIHAARDGRKTVLLTVDPARRLATALRLPMATGERATVGVGGGRWLEAIQLDTQRTFDELIRRFAGSREREHRILSNPFYRRISDTLAGTHEYMAMEKLFELAEEEDHDLIVIDTPPTRSALSFLDAPERLTDFLGGRFLRLMLGPTARAGRLTLSAARIGANVFLRTAGRLVGAEVLADTIDFLASFEGMYGEFKARAARVLELLRSPECAFVVVTAPAAGSLEEAGYFVDRLQGASMRASAVVANRWDPEARPLPPGAGGAAARLEAGEAEQRAAAAVLSARLHREPRLAMEAAAMARFALAHGSVPLLAVPELAGDVHDIAGLRKIAGHLFGESTQR